MSSHTLATSGRSHQDTLPHEQHGSRAQDGRVSAWKFGLNGFLAAGLLWGAVAADPVGFQVRVFFLGCVIVAGLFGAATVNRRILIVQALPAVIALAVVLLARPGA